MTNEEKIKKILACASTKFGMSCEIYYDISKKLMSEGLIKQNTVYTTGGNRVERLFLTRKEA